MKTLEEVKKEITELRIAQNELESAEEEMGKEKYRHFIGKCFQPASTSVVFITNVESVKSIGLADRVTFNCIRIFSMGNEYSIEETFYTTIEMCIGETEAAMPNEIPMDKFIKSAESAFANMLLNCQKIKP